MQKGKGEKEIEEWTETGKGTGEPGERNERLPREG